MVSSTSRMREQQSQQSTARVFFVSKIRRNERTPSKTFRDATPFLRRQLSLSWVWNQQQAHGDQYRSYTWRRYGRCSRSTHVRGTEAPLLSFAFP